MSINAIPYNLSFPLGTVCSAPYRNHRGEVAVRRFIPRLLYFGTSEFHPQPGWKLEVFDMERQAERTFALKGFEAAATVREGG